MIRLLFCLVLGLVPFRICAQTLADPIGESFVLAQAGFASSAGNALRQIGLRAAAQDPAQATAVRERQNLIETLSHTEARLADDLGKGTVTPALLAEVADLKTRIERLEQGISAGFSGFEALASPRPLEIATVRALLEPDEALLFVMSAKATSFVWFITPDFASWHRFNHGQEALAAVVRLIRLGLGARIRNAAPRRLMTVLAAPCPAFRWIWHRRFTGC